MCFPRIAPRFLAVAAVALFLTACDKHGLDFVVAPEFDDTFLFESGLGDWTARSKDVTGDTWEVVTSPDRASQGTQSVRLRLDNKNSQGKIWIEKKYKVEKDQLYTVQVSFDFGSADFGGVNLWQIVAGAAPDSPATAGAALPQGDTGNGQATDQGYRFVPRTFTFETTSDKDEELFVHVGVWGTSAFLRTYYVDNMKVVLTRKGLSPKL
jgi:hypothetical protein